jgi:hypothetical protein
MGHDGPCADDEGHTDPLDVMRRAWLDGHRAGYNEGRTAGIRAAKIAMMALKETES